MINVRCPICGQPMQGESLAQLPQFPFCGQRCKLIDLGRWLGEDYRIEAEDGRDAPAEPETTEIP